MILSPTAPKTRHRPGFLYRRRILSGRPDQVPVARRLVTTMLAGHPRASDAEIVMSELVTNAIRFTASGRDDGWLIAEVRTDNLLLAGIAVHDLGHGGTPKFADTNLDDAAECGRGLAIVSALAVRTGYRLSHIGGHLVWANLLLTWSETGKVDVGQQMEPEESEWPGGRPQRPW